MMVATAHNVHFCIANPRTAREAVFSLFRLNGIEIEKEKHLIYEYNTFSIEHARELKYFVSAKNSDTGIVYICIFVEHILVPAQSVLLKTLEELDPNIWVCFVVPFEHLLIPALRSRVLIHHLAKTSTPTPIDVALFFKSNSAKRLVVLDAFLKKYKDSPDEDLHREVRNFLDAYEEYVYGVDDIAKTRSILEALYFVKEYAPEKSSSPKQLLEYLALH